MNSRLIIIALALLSLALVLRLFVFFANLKDYPQGFQISFESNVSSQVKESIRGQQVSLYMPNSQLVVVNFPLSPVISYGDKLRIEGKINYFQAKNGKKIASIKYPRFVVISRGEDRNLIYRVRENIIKVFNSSLSSDYSALMLGIVFGIKEEMSPNFKDNLQKTGLLHVIAASGMNVAMVGGFLLVLFGSFMRRQLALIFTIFGILFYAFMAGFEASIVRASIMGILVFLAQLTGRQSSSFLGLFIAGFIMLFKTPILLFDIGFQLSFMATLGLIYFRPLLLMNNSIKAILNKSSLVDDLLTTLSAQIFTLPIIMANFGNYSIYSVFVNVLVLWTVPILMIIGGIASVLGIILLPLGTITSYLALPFLVYFQFVVNSFSQLGGIFEIDSFPLALIVGYYMILFSLVLISRKKE